MSTVPLQVISRTFRVASVPHALMSLTMASLVTCGVTAGTCVHDMRQCGAARLLPRNSAGGTIWYERVVLLLRSGARSGLEGPSAGSQSKYSSLTSTLEERTTRPLTQTS